MDTWTKTVFRVRRLPSTADSDSTVQLLSRVLGGYPPCDIRVFSLASSLRVYENPRSKTATVLFRVLPSPLENSASADEWQIPTPASDSGVLLFDTHFMGLTPLNDVHISAHLYDCIALSGLASHPFGSWQPKGPDKSFMWIRDDLPQHMPGTRAVIYGYNTKLHDSHSFQNIADIAREFISQLQACGFHLSSSKPLAFLAHSLGGLVLREALVQLVAVDSVVYKALVDIIRGAVFFGVPNLGMEQAHFRTIVQNNPNEALVDDIARNSNYLRRLNESFSQDHFKDKFSFIWAYETSESPTATRDTLGNVDRNGPPAILVSRESATLRLIDTNPSMTFPINATHSDMVKFAPDSHYYHTVISKLCEVLAFAVNEDALPHGALSRNIVSNGTLNHDHLRHYTSTENNQSVMKPISRVRTLIAEEVPSTQLGNNVQAEIERFTRDVNLTGLKEAEFCNATFLDVQLFLGELQTEQAKNQQLMHLRRIEPFLKVVQQLEESLIMLRVCDNASEAMGFIWGPLHLILSKGCRNRTAFHLILDAYQDVGLQIPSCRALHPILLEHPHLRHGLTVIYTEILDFQKEILRQMSHPQWQQLFKASWRSCTERIEHIKSNISRIHRTIEAKVSLVEFEEVMNTRTAAVGNFHRDEAASDAHRRNAVLQWLAPFDCEPEQERLRKIRSVCSDPGQWLLNNTRFRAWLDPLNQSMPLLWLNGIPGAGKTVLASVIVDAVRDTPSSKVLFFYCKHKEETRNSFSSVARSLLAQILTQKPHLLSYFHEKTAMDSSIMLRSISVAKELMTLGFGCYERLYIILDGLDECEHEDRKEIATWFQRIADDSSSDDKCSVRCLFVSQNDGTAAADFRNIPEIKIDNENREDLKDFSKGWQRQIEQKFGKLDAKHYNVSQIISAKAQGMFIFAELFAKYLESQINRADLIKELEPTRLPVNLDHVYERILSRIFRFREGRIADHIREILSWIVCAKRPLRWHEIQGAVSIDLENQCLNHDRQLSETPKSLFASLVELRDDGTVQLVHETARRYLLSQNIINPANADISLSMLSMGYLSLPQMSMERSKESIASDVTDGVFAFYDYSSACWAMHLQSGLTDEWNTESLADLQETLEIFIDLHWSPTHKLLQDVKRIQKSLEPLQSSNCFDRIVQSVAWSRRQGSKQGQGPSPDEALDISQITKKWRYVLENMLGPSLSATEGRQLQRFYGKDWFKCPRVNCGRYFTGFETAMDRDQHVNKHERPFLCFIIGCHVEVFGCSTEGELKKHLVDYHGIDLFDEAAEPEFPQPPKEKSSKIAAKSDGKFQCDQCEKSYTRSHNLNNHKRIHLGTKPYSCSICKKPFTRKADCDRHERGHGEKTFICKGTLKNGGTWGCNAAFGRADKLADHMKSKTGQKCMRKLMLELLEESDTSAATGDNMFADQTGENAKELQAAGRILPSFQEFLRLSGVDESYEAARKLLNLTGPTDDVESAPADNETP